MKTLYTIIALTLISLASTATPVITAKNNNGSWKNNSTWSLNRVPRDGDTVLIPAGMTVIINDNQNLGNQTLCIRVYGRLDFDGGKLFLDENSTIIIYASGQITANGSNSEFIKIGGDFKFRGTSYLQTGPAIANSSTGTSPNGFQTTGNASLPVTFLSFNVARQDKNLVLQWSTAQEWNSRSYEIQRSENGSNWSTIGTVNAAGNSNTTIRYSFTDRTNNAARAYYRLRQVDIDGKFDYSVVRMINADNNSSEIKIASGTSNHIYVHFSNRVSGDVKVNILSLNGQVISTQSLNNPIGQQLITVNNTIAKGVYVVSVSNENGLSKSGKVIL